MKTNNPYQPVDPSVEPGNIPRIRTGEIPFLFRQKALINVTGHTLRPGGLMLTSRAVDFCGFDPGARVLDAGCGYGMTARYLSDRFGIRALGADLGLDMLEMAAAKSGDRIPFAQVKLPFLPFGSGSLDGIFSECVFSLIREKERCLEEFLRCLRRNGKLILTDLYIPQRFAGMEPETRNPSQAFSCLDGALPILDLIRTIEDAGFQIDIIEDHTRLLKQLAGQMIFEHGSLDRFWEKTDARICDSGLASSCRSGRLRPGYCMIIAGKYKA
ncbi:DVU_1556 family methyltransferase [Desulfospira joergensenii]|uniref:DVU_1556 family methyltransferase n=1 Tax=Desulfospira joergensenii TaxID=53329 RepID=UPI0003B6262A|nr:class I SAM-dependent methyltransferase [Desulfospira joergensenii]